MKAPTPPPELARLTAASLAAAGLQVTGPEPADPAGCRLTIACHAAHCALTVTDSATAELHWSPKGEHADPHRVAALAAALLSGQPATRDPDTAREGITFKGIVGMDLRASGFHVKLNLYPDDLYYDVIADVTATDPSAGNSGAVHVTDDGGLTWERDYWDEHADTAREPHFRTWLPDPPAVAQAIAQTVTRALSTAASHELAAAC